MDSPGRRDTIGREIKRRIKKTKWKRSKGEFALTMGTKKGKKPVHEKGGSGKSVTQSINRTVKLIG